MPKINLEPQAGRMLYEIVAVGPDVPRQLALNIISTEFEHNYKLANYDEDHTVEIYLASLDEHQARVDAADLSESARRALNYSLSKLRTEALE